MPVWQAVRPDSRALSVHQGKGSSAAQAKVGALLEAVESHCAESFDQEGPHCRFDVLPSSARAASLADFAARRDRPPNPDTEYRWAEARDLLSGDPLFLPFEVASLDFTCHAPSRFDRASNGVAVGATRDEALATALQEVIERDAVIEWQAGGLIHCTASSLRVETVPHDWLHFWLDRLRANGIAARLYRVPSLTGSPVFACELNDRAKDNAAYHLSSGYGCHAEPELALFKALAEALQSRTTYISGAREDLFWFYGPAPPDKVLARFGLPLPAGLPGVRWDEIGPGPVGSRAIAGALRSAGYTRTAILDLAELEGLHVVRAFAFGLGSTSRRRAAGP